MLVIVPVTPPDPAGRANGDQSAIFRTLANPLRRRILSHLQQHREANSTSLARALGENTGTTSYHLRKLAEQGFVEEVLEKSDGRERWWRPLPFHIQAPDPAKMAAAEWSAAIEHARARAEHDIDLYFRVLTQYEGPEGWAQYSRGGSHMTKQELLAFYQEYIALLQKYGHAAHDAPEGARPVAMRFFTVPDDTAMEEGTGELPPDRNRHRQRHRTRAAATASGRPGTYTFPDNGHSLSWPAPDTLAHIGLDLFLPVVAPRLLGCPGTVRHHLVSAARRGCVRPDGMAGPGTC